MAGLGAAASGTAGANASALQKCGADWPCRSQSSVRYSFASLTPSGPMPKVASRSGRDGLLTILHTRVSPRPFLSHRRVVEAWAMMLPPMGLTLRGRHRRPVELT